MKKKIILAFFMSLLLIGTIEAQNCYKQARKDGIGLYNTGKYADALAKFKEAKACRNAPRKNDLKSWTNKANAAHVVQLASKMERLEKENIDLKDDNYKLRQKKRQLTRDSIALRVEIKNLKQQQSEADKKRILAEAEVARLKSEALAGKLAIKAMKLSPEKKELKALLVKEGYNRVKEAEGNTNQEELFLGMYQGMKGLHDVKAFNIHKKHNGSVRDLIIFENTIHSVSGDGKVMEWEVKEWKSLDKPELSLQPIVLAKTKANKNHITANSDRSFLAVGGSEYCHVFPLKSSQDPMVIDVHKKRESWDIVFTAADVFLSSGADKKLKKHNFTTGKTTTISALTKQTRSLSIHPSDSTFLVGGNQAGQLLIWNLAAEGTEPQTIETELGEIWSSTFSPDGQHLVLGYESGVIGLWSVNDRTVEFVKLLEGHTARIADLNFSKDGQFLASASFDRSTRVWESASFTEKEPRSRQLFDENSWAMSAIFTTDNSQLIVGYKNGNIQFWALSAAAMAEQICKGLERDMTEEEWNRYLDASIPFRKACELSE